jgi:hypothetical protein
MRTRAMNWTKRTTRTRENEPENETDKETDEKHDESRGVLEGIEQTGGRVLGTRLVFVALLGRPNPVILDWNPSLLTGAGQLD